MGIAHVLYATKMRCLRVVLHLNVILVNVELCLSLQHHQWLCTSSEGGAQAVPRQGTDSPAQGAGAGPVPGTISVLRRAVLGEGPLSGRAG